MRILLVDDEVELTEPLSQVLSQEGYQVDVANDGEQGSQLATSDRYDLIVLDWLMPGKSGLEVCRQLRRSRIETPVLFLTAKDTIDDRVEGLDGGADDYLVKPFELRELLARVRALLRRFGEREERDRLHFGDLELDRDNQLLHRQGKAIALSVKEMELLEFFMRHPGQLLTHQQIHEHLWAEDEQPNSNVLAALVRLLRRKIESKGESSLIHAVYGKGYRFGHS